MRWTFVVSSSLVHTSLLDIVWATNTTQATKLLSAGSPLRTYELLQRLISVRNKPVYKYKYLCTVDLVEVHEIAFLR
jgi:hypothetical protein